MNVSALKDAARGRWPEIFSALGGVLPSILDGKNHPCPKCEGTDRFRMIDQDDGALFCNQCFADNNGDGIAALMWLTGWTFKETLDKLADYLGLKGDRPTKTRKAKLADGIAKIEPINSPSGDNLLIFFGQKKPPITLDGIKKCGGQLVRWYDNTCIRLDGRSTIGAADPTAVVLIRTSGNPFPATKNLAARKTHTLGGSVNSLIASGSAEDIENAHTILDVEGISDLLAAASNLSEGMVAVTNTAGANARGKLPREWARGRRVIVAGDADEPGQDGQRRAVIAYHEAGAAEVLFAQLPYPIEKDHGRDIRDWLAEGGKLEDLLAAPAVTPEQIAEWSNSTKATPTLEVVEVTNAIVFDDGDTKATLPIPMSDIIEAVHKLTDGELHRIDKSLFVHAAGCPIDWIVSPSALFGWLQSRLGVIRWQRGTGCVGKEELFCELQRQAPRHDAVESLPHWPPIPSHYYTCPIPDPGDGHALAELIGMFCVETDLDRELTTALYATPAWGGPAGLRPAWLVTASAGRGKGKTRYTQYLASVFGGHLDISPQEDIGIIKQRLLSPEAVQKRLATIDNLKTPRFSWGDFENLVTAGIISGKRMYVGDASRPNLITWLITLNGASLSTDMAQRVVEVRLAEPAYDATWEERVAGFIDANRDQIIADCIGFLQRPAKPMKRHSRWATWESQVLSKVEHPDECLSLILERRGFVDVEEEESAIIEDFFAHKVAWLGYDRDRDDVFIPNDLAARWYNAATGDQKKTTGVTRALKQLHDEGRMHRLVQCRTSKLDARGFRWIGELADSIDVTHYDIRERMAHKCQDQKQPNSGADRS